MNENGNELKKKENASNKHKELKKTKEHPHAHKNKQQQKIFKILFKIETAAKNTEKG